MSQGLGRLLGIGFRHRKQIKTAHDSQFEQPIVPASAGVFMFCQRRLLAELSQSVTSR